MNLKNRLFAVYVRTPELAEALRSLLSENEIATRFPSSITNDTVICVDYSEAKPRLGDWAKANKLKTLDLYTDWEEIEILLKEKYIRHGNRLVTAINDDCISLDDGNNVYWTNIEKLLKLKPKL